MSKLTKTLAELDLNLSSVLKELDDAIQEVQFLIADSIFLDPSVIFGFGGVAAGFEFMLTPGQNSLSFVALNDATSVPEPSTLGLLGAGLVALAFRRRRTT